MKTAFVSTVTALLLGGAAHAGSIVNVGGTVDGFHYYQSGGSDPAPQPGEKIVPITDGSPFNQLTLGPGTYSLTNATGLAGANPDYTAWRFDGGPQWTWSIVVGDHSTYSSQGYDTVVFYTDDGGVFGSQQDAANAPATKTIHGTFTLPTTTTLDFMIRDYYLPDNAGGVAVFIQPVGVPEPATLALVLLAAPSVLARARRPTSGR